MDPLDCSAQDLSGHNVPGAGQGYLMTEAAWRGGSCGSADKESAAASAQGLLTSPLFVLVSLQSPR